MKIKYAIAALLMLMSHEAMAQGNTTGLVVSSCGNQTFKAGNPGPFTVDLTGKICVNLGSGVGTVTSVSVTTANGVSGVVANPTTTPAITLTLGAITPTTVAINGATIGPNALAVNGTILTGPSPSSAPSFGNIYTTGAINSPASTTQLMQDIFTGSGTFSGRSPLIGPSTWSVSGGGTITISGGFISANSNAYAFQSSSTTPYEIGGIFRSVGTAATTTMAVLLNSGNLNDMVHINFGPTAVTPLYWKTGGTASCPAGTSCQPTWVVSPTFTSLAADTDYVARLVINGSFVDAWIEDLSGNVLGRTTFYDATIPSIIGPNAMWQLSATTSRWSQVWMRPLIGYNTSDYSVFNAGINGPVGRVKPADGFFTSLNVGAGAPTGLFSVKYSGASDVPQIVGINRAGNLIITSDTSGNVADLTLTNGAGSSALMEMDGSFQHRLKNGSNFWLTKPSSGAPFFDGGSIGLGSAPDVFLTRTAAGVSQHGAADAAVAVAQTTRVQSVVAGTAAANGANWTLIGSLPTGTGTSGDIIIQTGVKTGSGTTQGTPTTALTIKGETQALVTSALDSSTAAGGALQVAGGASVAKRFWIPAITASSGLQTAVLCQSSGGEMIADSVACLASSARFKDIRGPLSSDIVSKFMKLPIKVWAYKEEGIFKKGNWTRDRIGPIAEDVEKLDPRLVEYDKDGQVRAYSTEQLLAYTIKVVQEQQHQIDNLRMRSR